MRPPERWPNAATRCSRPPSRRCVGSACAPGGSARSLPPPSSCSTSSMAAPHDQQAVRTATENGSLSHLRSGDTLVVWRLDRLGRSLAHLIDTIRELQERGVGFRSLQEQIDTTTSGGKLVFHVFGALAEF